MTLGWNIPGIVKVMISMLAWIVVDRGFDLQSWSTKDYKIDLCCFSAKHTTLKLQEQKLVGLD
jgi:hypothetical protein